MDTQSSIRIIGGKWRSRKVKFMTKDTLRPTPDRVRETLFNWLAPEIVGTSCLDLYAGSGALGLEALSRGAKSVVALESDGDNCKQIKLNVDTLQAENYTVLSKNVLDWLRTPQFSADIVFVDPPYKQQLLGPTMQLLEERNWVHVNSLIYFEQDQPFDPKILPSNWALWRQSKAGHVFYFIAIKER